MLAAFLEEGGSGDYSSIRHIITAGEALRGSLQARCLTDFPQVRLWNLVGSTEAAMIVLYWHCPPGHGAVTPTTGHE